MSELSERFYIMEQKQRNKEREREQRKKEFERAQRKRDQKAEQKQYEKDLVLACKRDLREKFEEEFRLQGINAKFHFFKIENRDILIKTIGKTALETDYLETNYNKILNEVIKKYELNEQYKEQRNKEIAEEYVEKMRPTWEKERKQQERKNVANNILLGILSILGHPFILISLFVLGFLISMFIGALGFGFFKAIGFSIITFIVLAFIFLGFIG